MLLINVVACNNFIRPVEEFCFFIDLVVRIVEYVSYNPYLVQSIHILINFSSRSFQWYEKFTNVDEVIPVSAKYGHGIEDVKHWILSKIPLGPAYFPKVSRFLFLLVFYSKK